MSVIARVYENADRRGGVHSFYFSALAKERSLCLENGAVGADASWHVIPLSPRPSPPPPQPSIKLPMLFPVQWTALRWCAWTLSARSTAALRLPAAVDSPGLQGLTQLGELAWVSCTHGGGRYGQGGGHDDRPRLRSHQREHPCHQSGDHGVLQVGSRRLESVRAYFFGRGVTSERFGCVFDFGKQTSEISCYFCFNFRAET